MIEPIEPEKWFESQPRLASNPAHEASLTAIAFLKEPTFFEERTLDRIHTDLQAIGLQDISNDPSPRISLGWAAAEGEEGLKNQILCTTADGIPVSIQIGRAGEYAICILDPSQSMDSASARHALVAEIAFARIPKPRGVPNETITSGIANTRESFANWVRSAIEADPTLEQEVQGIIAEFNKSADDSMDG